MMSSTSLLKIQKGSGETRQMILTGTNPTQGSWTIVIHPLQNGIRFVVRKCPILSALFRSYMLWLATKICGCFLVYVCFEKKYACRMMCISLFWLNLTLQIGHQVAWRWGGGRGVARWVGLGGGGYGDSRNVKRKILDHQQHRFKAWVLGTKKRNNFKLFLNHLSK